ncbi:hypothetical protein AYO43_06715 [Nitrospira sp. SCGC AG-212-E16]|nr:hypothetical protein AYO43_06715 [Nitrospira sp. SCGC AG-212-E16]
MLWFVWFVLFIWLNQTNRINQRNQKNQMNQTNQNKGGCSEYPWLNATTLRYTNPLFVQRERDKQDLRDRRCTKFKVLGSKFRELRTSDLEPSAVSPVALFSQVTRSAHCLE